MTTHTITVYLEFGDEEREAVVEFDYLRGSPGRMYMSNGDPGYPDDPDELEVNSVKIDGAEATLTDEQCEKVEGACWDYLETQWQDGDDRDYDF